MVTRRDFLNGALIGAGDSLLTPIAQGASASRSSEGLSSQYQILGPDWTGPGGIGDYRFSNGNTHPVVNAAHSIRDHYWDRNVDGSDIGEVDMLIVGGGFSGLSAAYTYLKEGKKDCLILENHPIFGGEAKQNEFQVDGYHLYAPQGSNSFIWPASEAEKLGGLTYHPLWKEVGLPSNKGELAWKFKVSGTGKQLKFPEDSFAAMLDDMGKATVGFFCPDPKAVNGYRVVRNPQTNDFKDLPWSDQAKRELLKLRKFIHPGSTDKNGNQWLDGITYKEYLQKVVGITQREVFEFYDPVVSGYGGGLGSDVVSAYSAMLTGQPGFAGLELSALGASGAMSFGLSSFPGGNSGIARHIVKTLIPDSIQGQRTLHDILFAPLDWQALDRSSNKVRLRVGATATRVEHIDKSGETGQVKVTYIKDDKVYSVRANGVVMAGGQWINKHVLRDAPQELHAAMNQFNHAPFLSVNVGLRNWRFMEKAGISCARWFEGFGWFASLQAPMIVDGRSAPLHPDKPIVMTLYIPFVGAVAHSGLPLREQAVVARTQLYNMSYLEIEQKILRQLGALFGGFGFNAKKDVAAIITNRWGHAYIIPQPGFYFGENGKPAARDIVKQGYGKIRFSHSELTGFQGWSTAAQEGERAAREILRLL